MTGPGGGGDSACGGGDSACGGGDSGVSGGVLVLGGGAAGARVIGFTVLVVVFGVYFSGLMFAICFCGFWCTFTQHEHKHIYTTFLDCGIFFWHPTRMTE